jgi:hypothetical protein
MPRAEHGVAVQNSRFEGSRGGSGMNNRIVQDQVQDRTPSRRTNALRALLRAEQDRGPDFLRLANALSALYPRESEEKRLLDIMLLAVPR